MRFKSVYIPKEYKVNLFADYRKRLYERTYPHLNFLPAHEQLHIDYQNYCNAKKVALFFGK